MQLTVQESAFLECLKNVDAESIWGLAISNVVKNPDVERFRDMVQSLKSQANDNPNVMIDILGQQCFDNLINL